jgi:hypothetical protein
LDRWLTRLGPVVGLLLVVILGKLAANSAIGHYDEDSDGNWIEVMFFVGFTAGMFWLIWAMLLIHRARLRREGTIYIKSSADIDRAIAAMAWASHWMCRPALFSRQATVIAVADVVWRDALRMLAPRASSVVLDMSERTESVLWEMSALRDANIRATFIADHQCLGGSMDPKPHPANCDNEASPLTYQLLDRQSLRAFRRQLTQRLFESAIVTVESPVSPGFRVRRLSKLEPISKSRNMYKTSKVHACYA